jgi:hypothetical protein
LDNNTGQKIMYQVIVAQKELASTEAHHIDDGCEWVVEGDYGFLGCYKTQGQAWKAALDELASINKYAGAIVAEIQLNA